LKIELEKKAKERDKKEKEEQEKQQNAALVSSFFVLQKFLAYNFEIAGLPGVVEECHGTRPKKEREAVEKCFDCREKSSQNAREKVGG